MRRRNARNLSAREDLGRLLRGARKNAGLVQEEAAHRIGVHWTTISNYERGKNYPSPEVMDKIFDVYSIRQSDVFAIFGDFPKGDAVELTPDEEQLVDMYRQASPILRASTFEGLRAGLRMEQTLAQQPSVAEGPGSYQEGPGTT